MITNQNKIYWLFDVESTLYFLEGLKELAKISLNGASGITAILGKIEEVCFRGMNGEITFDQSLCERMSLISANRRHVKELAEKFKESLVESIRGNENFFIDYRDEIFVISGGFRDFLLPALLELGVKEENIFANTFIYDDDDLVVGFDKTNPLSKDGGKIVVARDLNLSGHVIVVGDGTSEAKVRDAGLANVFWAYTEVFENEAAIKTADKVISDFSQIVELANARVAA